MSTVTPVGRHRLACGDITSGTVARLMGEERADVVYSDPPWGPGNQKYWHTHNGTVPGSGWPEFLAAFCGAAAGYSKPGAHVFVEMGLRWVGELDAAMRDRGLVLARRWAITYGPRRAPLPLELSLYLRAGVSAPGKVTAPLAETYGPAVTEQVLSRVVGAGTVVLDPCTGKGMTARNTHRLGGSFRGSELNPQRLAVTEAWLRRHAP